MTNDLIAHCPCCGERMSHNTVPHDLFSFTIPILRIQVMGLRWVDEPECRYCEHLPHEKCMQAAYYQGKEDGYEKGLADDLPF